MAREIYDGDWMRQQLTNPLTIRSADQSSDLAGPIKAEIRRPSSRYATRCEWDEEGDLVYGEDVRVIESEEPQKLELPYLGPMIVRAKIFETSDKALLGHSIAYTAYPYSRNDRGRASFKLPSHHAGNNRWEKIEDQIREKTLPLTRIIDGLHNDPFRTYGDTLRCYILEPEQDQADLFSNRRASKSELQKALRWIREDVDPDRDPNELLPDSITDIILFGIVEDYDQAFSWLIGHETSQRLVNMAEEGTLFEPIVNYRTKSMTNEAKNAAQAFLELAAHNVLCGTYDPEAYRGYYEPGPRAKGRSDAALSIATDANRGRPERGGDQVRRYKQTLAVHLEHRFLDLMYNYNRAIRNKEGFRPVVTSSQQSHHTGKAQAEGISLEEAVHLIEERGLLDRKQHAAAKRRLKAMIESVRQGSQDLPDPDMIFSMLALTVALHQRNAADTESIDFVKSLPQLATDWDEDLQALIEEAIKKLDIQ
jgi:hypothetical protein